jgi:hypothetical protein
MKAIYINAEKQYVSEVDVDEKSVLQEWYSLIKTDIVEVGLPLENRNQLLVDEEGLMKIQFGGFSFDSHYFVGNGLVVATDKDGESVSTTLTEQNIEKRVKFN